MCFPNRWLDSKSKRIIPIANLCLVAGLLLLTFVHPSSQISGNWLHGVSGVLLGISISMNLFGLRLARRSREKQI